MFPELFIFRRLQAAGKYGKIIKTSHQGVIIMPSPESLYNEALKYHEAGDYNQAFRLFSHAAYLDHRQAQFYMGVYHANGFGIPQDYIHAFIWYEKAAKAGDSDAMNNLGALYEHGQGITQNYAEARKWYEKAATLGNSQSIRNLGAVYERGTGVSRDYTKAFEYYMTAAKQGHLNAQYNVGRFYENGFGVAQDHALAFYWYSKAALSGDPDAQNGLGVLYHTGKGVEKDYIQARQWFQKAAEKNHCHATNNLGVYYDNGFGVPKDSQRAFEYFRDAARLGSLDGQYHTGRCYELGIGVAKNIQKAIEYYKKAADQGFASAAECLKRLQPKLSCPDYLLDKLDSFVGLHAVKPTLRQLPERAEPPRFLIFTGNSGTGKSLVAHWLGQVYQKTGLLSSSLVVEVSAADITTQKIKDAQGGILLIRDADKLSPYALKGFLPKDDRDILVIAACAPGTDGPIASGDPRFRDVLHFPDYTLQELLDIFHRMSLPYSKLIPAEIYVRAQSQIRSAESGKGKHFRNAYEVADILEHILLVQGSRSDYYQFLSAVYDL